MPKRPMTVTWPRSIIIEAEADFSRRRVVDAESGETISNVRNVTLRIGSEGLIRADVVAYAMTDDGKIDWHVIDGAVTLERSFVMFAGAFKVNCESEK